jgi:hypothetical protein
LEKQLAADFRNPAYLDAPLNGTPLEDIRLKGNARLLGLLAATVPDSGRLGWRKIAIALKIPVSRSKRVIAC